MRGVFAFRRKIEDCGGKQQTTQQKKATISTNKLSIKVAYILMMQPFCVWMFALLTATTSTTTISKKLFVRAALAASSNSNSNSMSSTTSTTTEQSCAASATAIATASSAAAPRPHPLVPPIDPERRALLQQHGVTMEELEPVGARVMGLDLHLRDGSAAPSEAVLKALETEMAHRGFLVFANQGVLTPDEQIRASTLWGGREMHSTHGVHPATPDHNRHIFRLSNNPAEGTLGVGPQWHNDGSFVEGTFSHVGYHLIRVPEGGGGTYFAHQGAAFDVLPPQLQERWSRLVSINSNSGVLHPVVHTHPISGRKSVWLHLGMTGAVIEYLGDDALDPPYRLLDEEEMKELFNTYNDLLNNGLQDGYTINYEYLPGDFLVIDNLAVSHKASPEAHRSYKDQGLRILHRTTVKATQPFEPGFGLPQATDIYGPNPFGKGVWIGGGIGYNRWAEGIHFQN